MAALNSRDLALQALQQRVLDLDSNTVSIVPSVTEIQYAADGTPSVNTVTFQVITTGLVSTDYDFSFVGLATGIQPTISGNTATVNVADIEALVLQVSVSVTEFGNTYQALPVIVRKNYLDITPVLSRAVDAISADLEGESYTLPNTFTLKLYSGITEITTGVTYGPATTQTKSGLSTNINTSTGVVTLSQASDNAWVSDYETFTFIATYKGKNYAVNYSIYKVRSSGLLASVQLSNPVTLVSASATGIVSSFENTSTFIRVFDGATELTYNGVGTSNGTWTVSKSVTGGITTPNTYFIPVENEKYITTADITGLTDDTGTIIFTITGKNLTGNAFSLTISQTIGKSKTAPAPFVSISGIARFNASYDGSVYDPSTMSLAAVIANITNPTYAWTIAGATPTSGSQSTLLITPTADLVTITLTVDGDNLFDPISITESVRATYDGNPGPSIDISGVTGFNKNVGGLITPATAELTATTAYVFNPTYTWTVTNATASALNTQSITITPTGINPITVSLTVNGTNLISPLQKEVKMVIVQDGQTGQAGANGLMSAFPAIYKWTNSSTAPSRPTTTSTYTWATAAYTAPDTWFTTPPTSTTPGEYLWTISVPLNVSATTTQSTLDWTDTNNAIRAIAYNGSDGPQGPQGPAGEAGEAGPAGSAGSATFVVIRTANDSSAPTNLETQAVIGRDPIAGDIVTVNYNSGNNSIVYKYTTSWVLTTSYITGSLIVENTITAANMATGTITAESGVIGSINADTITAGTITGRTYQTTSDINANRRIAINEADNNQIIFTGALNTPTETYGELARLGEATSSFYDLFQAQVVNANTILSINTLAADSTPVNMWKIGVNIANSNRPAINIYSSFAPGITLRNTSTTRGAIEITGAAKYGIRIEKSPTTNLDTGIYINGYKKAGIEIGGPDGTNISGWSLDLGTVGVFTSWAEGYGPFRCGAISFYEQRSSTTGTLPLKIGAAGNWTNARLEVDISGNLNIFNNTGIKLLNYANNNNTITREVRINNQGIIIPTNSTTIPIQIYQQSTTSLSTTTGINVNLPRANRAIEAYSQQYPIYAAQSSSTTSGAGVYAFATNGYGVFGSGSSASFDFYAGGPGGNYGPFTGAHEGLVDKNINITVGDIIIDVELIARYNISNTIFKQAPSTVANDPKAVGVVIATSALDSEQRPAALKDYETYEALQQQYNRVTINALGEGQINVCKDGGNIQAGDYITTSNRPGKGQRQSDDIYHNYTVARARESVVWEAGDDEIKQVACIYLCG